MIIFEKQYFHVKRRIISPFWKVSHVFFEYKARIFYSTYTFILNHFEKHKKDKPNYPSTKTEEIFIDLFEKQNEKEPFLPPVFSIMTVRTFSKNFTPYKGFIANIYIIKFYYYLYY